MNRTPQGTTPPVYHRSSCRKAVRRVLPCFCAFVLPVMEPHFPLCPEDASLPPGKMEDLLQHQSVMEGLVEELQVEIQAVKAGKRPQPVAKNLPVQEIYSLDVSRKLRSPRPVVDLGSTLGPNDRPAGSGMPPATAAAALPPTDGGRPLLNGTPATAAAASASESHSPPVQKLGKAGAAQRHQSPTTEHGVPWKALAQDAAGVVTSPTPWDTLGEDMQSLIIAAIWARLVRLQVVLEEEHPALPEVWHAIQDGVKIPQGLASAVQDVLPRYAEVCGLLQTLEAQGSLLDDALQIGSVLGVPVQQGMEVYKVAEERYAQTMARIHKWVRRAKMVEKALKVAKDVEYVYENGVVAGLKQLAAVGLSRLEHTKVFRKLDGVYRKADAIYDKADAIYNEADTLYMTASTIYEDVAYVYENGLIAGLEHLPKVEAILNIAQTVYSDAAYVYENGIVAGLEHLPTGSELLDPKMTALFRKAQAKAQKYDQLVESLKDGSSLCNLSKTMESKLEAKLEAKVKTMGVSWLKSKALKVLQKKLVPYIAKRVHRRLTRVLGKLAVNKLKGTFAGSPGGQAGGGGLTAGGAVKFGLKGSICCGAKALCKDLDNGVKDDVDNADKDADKDADNDADNDAASGAGDDAGGAGDAAGGAGDAAGGAGDAAGGAGDAAGGAGDAAGGAGDAAGGAGDAAGGAGDAAGGAGDAAEDVGRAAGEVTRGVKSDVASCASDAAEDGADAAADAGADAAVDAGADAAADAGADLAVDAAVDSMAGPAGWIVLGVQVGAVAGKATGDMIKSMGEAIGGPFGTLLVWYGTAMAFVDGLVCDVFNDITDACEWLFMHTPLGLALKHIVDYFRDKKDDKGGVQYLPQLPKYQDEIESGQTSIQSIWEELMGNEWDSPTASMAVKYPVNPFPNDYMNEYFVFPKIVIACENGQVMYMCLGSGLRYAKEKQAGSSSATPWTTIRAASGQPGPDEMSQIVMDVDFSLGILDFTPPRIVMSEKNGSVMYYPGLGTDLNPSQEWVQLTPGFGPALTAMATEFTPTLYPKVVVGLGDGSVLYFNGDDTTVASLPVQKIEQAAAELEQDSVQVTVCMTGALNVPYGKWIMKFQSPGGVYWLESNETHTSDVNWYTSYTQVWPIYPLGEYEFLLYDLDGINDVGATATYQGKDLLAHLGSNSSFSLGPCGAMCNLSLSLADGPGTLAGSPQVKEVEARAIDNAGGSAADLRSQLSQHHRRHCAVEKIAELEQDSVQVTVCMTGALNVPYGKWIMKFQSPGGVYWLESNETYTSDVNWYTSYMQVWPISSSGSYTFVLYDLDGINDVGAAATYQGKDLLARLGSNSSFPLGPCGAMCNLSLSLAGRLGTLAGSPQVKEVEARATDNAGLRSKLSHGASTCLITMTGAINVNCGRWYVQLNSGNDNDGWQSLQSPKCTGSAANWGTSLQATWAIEPKNQYVFTLWDLTGVNDCTTQGYSGAQLLGHFGTQYGYNVGGMATVNLRLSYTTSSTDWIPLTASPWGSAVTQLRVNFSLKDPQVVVALQSGAVYCADRTGSSAPSWTQLGSTEGLGVPTAMRVQWRLPLEPGLPSLVVGFSSSAVQFWSGLPGCAWASVGSAGQWGSPVAALRVQFSDTFGGAPQVVVGLQNATLGYYHEALPGWVLDEQLRRESTELRCMECEFTPSGPRVVCGLVDGSVVLSMPVGHGYPPVYQWEPFELYSNDQCINWMHVDFKTGNGAFWFPAVVVGLGNYTKSFW